jgi:predicted enzyme related to lactoylglutathione lyase
MPRVVHFEIPAKDVPRAVEFYRAAFGWTIDKWKGPMDYWLVSTGPRGEPGIDGAIMDRTISKSPVATIEVPALEEYVRRVIGAGGRQCTPRAEVPGVGYVCYCEDTEGNLFCMLERLAGSSNPS